MGVASKVIHVILRLAQLFFSVIVLGLLANFVRLLNQAGAHKDGRIIYALVVACISMLFSIVFIAPFMYAFLAFPFDIVLFIMWLIAFCLLASRASGCSSTWFGNYWGYYWGRWWRRPGFAAFASTGCREWQTVLAFSFLAMIVFLLSGILGAIMVMKYYKKDRKERRAGTQTTQIGNPTLIPPGHGGVTSTAPGATGPGTAAPGTATGQTPAGYV